MGFSEWKQKLSETGYAKPVATTAVITGLGWLLYEVYATVNTLRTVGRVRTISQVVRYIRIDEAITKGLVLGQHGYLERPLGGRGLSTWLHNYRQRRAWRLLHLAQNADPELGPLAVRWLSLSQNLSESELVQLAQACNAHTAVGLARCPGTSQGFFLPPPTSYKTSENEELINELRDVLYRLNKESGHLCVKYFLTKAFPDYEKQANYLLDAEVMLTDPWTILTSQDNLMPMCVQALDHHISTLNNETLLVELGGIPLLMAVYQQLKDNINVCKMLCRLMTRICFHSEYLPQVFATGWIGVLASWVSSEDQLLSLLAAQCLSNLDRDEFSHANYGRHVVSLYPTHRAPKPTLDVVFVHGLLGGVFSTWRQRGQDDTIITGFQRDDSMEGLRVQRRYSDKNTEEYLQAVTELSLAEWEALGSDYEFVVSDFPVNHKTDSFMQYTLPGSDPHVRQYAADQTYSMCWPKDWLPRDCRSIRVLGIDYESRISEWFPTCSEKLRVKTLKERSMIVLEELKNCDIGKQPIVWVSHSMGGLLVKKMLTDALSSHDPDTQNIARNSKAVIFLSTPHLGCPLAKMNDILNYLLWPSTEVEELRHNSVVLNNLHERFQDLLKTIDVKIITFAEAKSTRISTLGVDLHIVPPEFSYFNVGDQFEMPCDHACVAKPSNRLSFIYQTILNLIRAVHEESKT